MFQVEVEILYIVAHSDKRPFGCSHEIRTCLCVSPHCSSSPNHPWFRHCRGHFTMGLLQGHNVQTIIFGLLFLERTERKRSRDDRTLILDVLRSLVCLVLEKQSGTYDERIRCISRRSSLYSCKEEGGSPSSKTEDRSCRQTFQDKVPGKNISKVKLDQYRK